MKNIHILPTDKPSRLVRNSNENTLKLCIQTLPLDKKIYCYPQHIYITNDEEIKGGDWFWKPDYNMIFKAKYTPHIGCKKVILTTDQDLIKDGVQAIDDEFLKWFVNNTSCEKIEFFDDTFSVREASKLPLGVRNHKYKIIIPKETKQETLEEAAKEYAEMHQDVSATLGKYLVKAVFQDGAQWQQERMYTEEHMKHAYTQGARLALISQTPLALHRGKFPTPEEWFNEFKKL